MGILLGFAPFVAFALIEKLLGPVPGLAAGALASIALLWRDRRRGDQELNLLEVGSALLFSVLTAIALLGDPAAWTLWRVRFWVDLGLLVIVLSSLAVGRPFTLHQARRQVTPEIAAGAAFLQVNRALSAVWAAAFAVLVAVDAWMVLRPGTPTAAAVGVTVAALAAAALYTRHVATRPRR